jgi:hypothetical protein
MFDKSLMNREGIWFNARLLSANISQYIVSVYVLFAGIQLTKRGKENYDAEETKDVINDISSSIFDSAIDEGLLESVMSNLTQVLGTFASQTAVDGLCDSFTSSSIERACNQTGTGFVCAQSPGFNYQCALIDMASTSSASSEYELQYAVIEAAGFDMSLVESTVRAAMVESTSTAVDSLYPSSLYM